MDARSATGAQQECEAEEHMRVLNEQRQTLLMELGGLLLKQIDREKEMTRVEEEIKGVEVAMRGDEDKLAAEHTRRRKKLESRRREVEELVSLRLPTKAVKIAERVQEAEHKKAAKAEREPAMEFDPRQTEEEGRLAVLTDQLPGFELLEKLMLEMEVQRAMRKEHKKAAKAEQEPAMEFDPRQGEEEGRLAVLTDQLPGSELLEKLMLEMEVQQAMRKEHKKPGSELVEKLMEMEVERAMRKAAKAERQLAMEFDSKRLRLKVLRDRRAELRVERATQPEYLKVRWRLLELEKEAEICLAEMKPMRETLLFQPCVEQKEEKVWEQQSVLVYQDEDFVTEQGGVSDAELLSCCRGRPVFIPELSQEEKLWDRKAPGPERMNREWARKTVQVLASDEILRPQILAGKLRFLGQPLSLVVEGARVKERVFTEEDLEFNPPKIAPEKFVRLRDLLLGRPVFFPEEGCEYALARKTEDEHPRFVWGLMLMLLLNNHPDLADGIISGSVAVDGRRWTEIQLPPLPVWNNEPSTAVHLFKNRERWQSSYDESRLVRVADFPQWKPDWAGKAGEEDYLWLLRAVAEGPVLVALDSTWDSNFYNAKHARMFRMMDDMIHDY